MPVPAEKDPKQKQQTSTTTSTDVTPAPAANPASPTSATHNGDVSSPVAEENGVAERSNEERSSSTSPSMQMSNGHHAAESESSEKPHKIFVGGLSSQTSEEKLKEIFEEYGEVTEYNIMKDPVNKRSRGFGFVTFKSGESVEKVLNAHTGQPICIDDKTIDPKIAIPPKRLSSKVKRIFVGGLSSDSMEEDLRDYFEQFGKVVEAQLMYDRNTSRHRGFGFVTFEHEEPAEKVCSIQYHDIKGKKVEVKVAQTKEALAMQQARNRMLSSRNYPASYGYPSPPYGPTFYPTSPHYPLDLMSMGGYSAAPVLIGGGMGGKHHRGLKGRNYSQYAFTYPPGSWGDHPRMGGYYGPAYGGMPMHLMRHPMDPVTTSGMDYISDQFQGIAISTAGYPPSPAGQYPPMTPISLGGIDPMTMNGHMTSGSYSPPHNLSPKGTVSTASVNGFTQVPTYSGSQSYGVAQPSY